MKPSLRLASSGFVPRAAAIGLALWSVAGILSCGGDGIGQTGAAGAIGVAGTGGAAGTTGGTGGQSSCPGETYNAASPPTTLTLSGNLGAHDPAAYVLGSTIYLAATGLIGKTSTNL